MDFFLTESCKTKQWVSCYKSTTFLKFDPYLFLHSILQRGEWDNILKGHSCSLSLLVQLSLLLQALLSNSDQVLFQL